MKMTRKQFLKIAGGMSIAVPLTTLMVSFCDQRLFFGRRTSQITVAPFQVPLPIPPILQPTRTDDTIDYYDVRGAQSGD